MAEIPYAVPNDEQGLLLTDHESARYLYAAYGTLSKQKIPGFAKIAPRRTCHAAIRLGIA